MRLKLMYITNNPYVATVAERAGVDRIFVDMEANGKAERQNYSDSVLSKHNLNDVESIRKVLTTAQLLTRVNPIYEGSKDEIVGAIKRGSDLIMLPFFKTKEEVERFVELVGGKAKTVCLVETKEAAESIDDILGVQGVDEYFVGLNDLHLSYGMKFIFEPLANGVVDELCKKFRWARKPYGFGGVARVDKGDLLSNHVLAEHCRLGSSAVILSRSFIKTTGGKVHESPEFEEAFKKEVAKIRKYERFLELRDPQYFMDEHELLRDSVKEITFES